MAVAQAVTNLIPAPASLELGAGSFSIQPSTRICFPAGAHSIRQAAQYFADLLLATRGMSLQLVECAETTQTPDSIALRLAPHTASADAESYEVAVSPQGIELCAREPRGLFYALVTLWQLCTCDSARSAVITVPALRISDAPRFRWRGLMLDSARHFQPLQFILRMIDWMALHKLNVLHWHLSDDQGWRLEIKKYPRLAQVGGFRKSYGGFYSQEIVRQIVQHAAARNVTIVPEVGMPGHATAAIVAYPHLGATEHPPRAVPSSWGIFPNVYNAEETTFQFLEDVLSEVVSLFPSEYLHIGGDEVLKDQWKLSKRVQARMRELAIPDETALQSYFVHRMEQHLRALGRKAIGWDEILDGSIAPGVAVMSWRGIDRAGAAAVAGHATVLSPWPTFYFDNRQSEDIREPPGRGRLNRLQDVYRFDPFALPIPTSHRDRILGVQANLWTEHVRAGEHAEHMTWPRAAAVAEIGWSAQERRDWRDFLQRLPCQFERYRSLGIHFSDEAFEVHSATRLDRARARVAVQLSGQSAIGEIRYTLDGTEPTAASPRYSSPLDLPASGQLRAAAFQRTRQLSRTISRALDLHSLGRRTSCELQTCTDQLVLVLEENLPAAGERATFLVDIMNPCWVFPAVDLSGVSAIELAVCKLPFNFMLGTDVQAIELDPSAPASGAIEIRLDTCGGEPVAVVPLAPALTSTTVTRLAPVSLPAQQECHDLYFKVIRRTLEPLWALAWVQLLSPDA
jgi:hexosaminidase